MVTLTTDFGLSDTYVAQMKGVILGLCPEAVPVDATHLVPPGDVLAGALALASLVGAFPPGTVHLSVVDPGVGTGRRPIAVRAGEVSFVCPDNGLASLAWGSAPEVFHLDRPEMWREEVSRTFHGRDVFAPVAARLAAGTPPEEMGRRVDDPVTVRLPEPRIEDGALRGEVIHVDSFGNLITNLRPADLERLGLEGEATIEAAGRRIEGLSESYSEKKAGELLVIVGSLGYLEIAAGRGRASDSLGCGRGAEVIISRKPGR